MSAFREAVEQDHIIQCVVNEFTCRVLWSEGRPCLEYQHEEDLEHITAYVEANFGVELLDVFFTAVESLPA